MDRTLHLSISGRVQGVGFRYALREQALAQGLCGWVRNRHDGGVEALIQGSEEAINTLVRWAQNGPPSAQVTDVRTEDWDSPAIEGFAQLPTH